MHLQSCYHTDLAVLNAMCFSLWTAVASLAPPLLRSCSWQPACQLGTALCAVLLDIQDVTVQEPLLDAVVSVLAAPGLSKLLQADRPTSAGGSSKNGSEGAESGGGIWSGDVWRGGVRCGGLARGGVAGGRGGGVG